MKLLKNGVAFAVALLTITLTIAAYAGAFKAEPKTNLQQVCNDANFDTDLPLRLKNGCAQIDPCPQNIAAGLLYGVASPIEEPFECPPTDDIYCCAVLGTPFTCSNGEVGQNVVSYLCGEPQR